MAEETRSARRGWVRRIVAHRPHLLPPEFHEHSRAARKELLLALRSLIDARIEQLERPGEEPAPKKTHRVKVE